MTVERPVGIAVQDADTLVWHRDPHPEGFGFFVCRVVLRRQPKACRRKLPPPKGAVLCPKCWPEDSRP
jgi:hypothetical protein